MKIEINCIENILKRHSVISVSTRRYTQAGLATSVAEIMSQGALYKSAARHRALRSTG